MNWVRDEELEAISDKIRRGEPVGFLQALAAIDYQTDRQKHARENTWWRRLLRRITSPTPPDPTPQEVPDGGR